MKLLCQDKNLLQHTVNEGLRTNPLPRSLPTRVCSCAWLWTSYSIQTFLFLISKMEVTVSTIFSYCVSYME